MNIKVFNDVYTLLIMRRMTIAAISAIVLLVGGCADPDALPPKAVSVKTTTNSIGMKMAFIPGGTFRMGSFKDKSAQPVHKVTLSSFWIGQYEVTNAESDLFKKRPRSAESTANRQPATRILWSDAVAFCEWPSKREGRVYRLPTEAEWEYAARGGLDQKEYPWGNEGPSGRATYGTNVTTPVGTYAPNGYGLYDMSGNIAEWCSDWYYEDYYSISPQLNPKGPAKPMGKSAESRPPQKDYWLNWTKWKVIRGGFYATFAEPCAERGRWSLDERPYVGIGFRVVMEDKIKESYER